MPRPQGDQYALKMRLVDHVYDDQVIDSLTVKLILPEGARSVVLQPGSVPCGSGYGSECYDPVLGRNIHVDTPYPIDRMPNQLHYTYLDTFGRPVLLATKSNLVEQHIQDVVVRGLGVWVSGSLGRFTGSREIDYCHTVT